MKHGEVLETAIWLDGTETPELMDRYRGDCADCIRQAAENHGVLFAPLVWAEKKPGEHRVPPVPEHIKGPNVRLLVAEAVVVCDAPQIPVRSLLYDLDPKDLVRLREITRKSYGMSTPGGAPLSDVECDKIIEEVGPQAAYEAVRKAVDTRVLH